MHRKRIIRAQMEIPVAKLTIRSEHDTVTARRLALDVAELAGFTPQVRTKIATAVSEIARNALMYAGGGTAVCTVLEQGRKQFLKFALRDEGPGIENVEAVLDGSFRSRTGMGVGISGTKKLVDLFALDTEPGVGTVVTMGMQLPDRGGPRRTEKEISGWARVLTGNANPSYVEEARRSSIDMARSLNVAKHREAELSKQLSEVERLNRELKAAQHKLHEQATLDALTGLPNRRAVIDELLKELARSRRSGQPLGVAIADLDHFKQLNDTRGHLAGDNALREAAERMRGAIRVYDTVGRYGGEEFLFVLPGCDVETAVGLAERIRRAVGDEPMMVDEEAARVTCSIGVVCGQVAADAEVLIDIADAALYRAKEGGRNRVEVATPDDVARALADHREREQGAKAPR
jgi:diguanylate cyclase (GGDEF)-like protein